MLRAFIIAACLVCVSCEQKTPVLAVDSKTAAPAPKPKLLFEVAENRDADDLARFLAGLPAREGSSFEELQNTAEWKAHAAQSARIWEAFETKREPPLQEFGRDELGRFDNGDPVMFYPFGGPDALTATLFFPNHTNYVLVGLEPPGSLVEANKFKPAELKEKLEDMRGTLDDLLNRSFFITRQMDQKLRGQITDGLLLPILLQLVREGDTIRGVEFTAVNKEGEAPVSPEPADRKTKNRGVVIEFEDGGHGLHQLAYFSVNLDDEHLAQNPQFFTWLNKNGDAVTFFKSTSYMLHQKQFSKIREQVLDHSIAVLQDDSGIPYHFFTEKNWKVQLYGAYDRPYGSFRYLVQPDLQKAFQAEGVKQLGFRIGYGFGKVPSNLLLATPK